MPTAAGCTPGQGTLLVGVWLVFLIEPLSRAAARPPRHVAGRRWPPRSRRAVPRHDQHALPAGSPREDAPQMAAEPRPRLVHGVLTDAGPGDARARRVRHRPRWSLAISSRPLPSRSWPLPADRGRARRGHDRADLPAAAGGSDSVSVAMLSAWCSPIAGCARADARATSTCSPGARQMTDLAVAAERERMARDLHDILGHSLTVIVMKADWPSCSPTASRTGSQPR